MSTPAPAAHSTDDTATRIKWIVVLLATGGIYLLPLSNEVLKGIFLKFALITLLVIRYGPVIWIWYAFATSEGFWTKVFWFIFGFMFTFVWIGVTGNL